MTIFSRLPGVRTVALALFVLPAGLGAASAHHSFAMYDADKVVTLKGQVREFNWTNPHASLLVTVVGTAGKAPQTWNLEMTSPGNLMRAGWTKRMFKPGDRVEVSLNPLRSGENGGEFLSATFTDTGVKTPRVGARDVNSKPGGAK